MREIVFTQLSVPPVLLVNTLQGCGWTTESDGVSVRALVFSCLLLEVFSLVTVQSAAVAKQLLPKTLGPSNVNVAAHVQHVPHMVSNAAQLHQYINNAGLLIFLNSLITFNLFVNLKLQDAPENEIFPLPITYRYICV